MADDNVALGSSTWALVLAAVASSVIFFAALAWIFVQLTRSIVSRMLALVRCDIIFRSAADLSRS